MRAPWKPRFTGNYMSDMIAAGVVFDPITALTAVSTIVSVGGAIGQASAASKADKFNAAVAQQNATAATEQGAAALKAQQRSAQIQFGAAKAGYGASGVTTDGSPMDVLSDSYTQSELDANNIIYNSKLKAAGYTNQANLDSASASNATRAGYVSAASKALLGGVKTYQAYDDVGDGSDGS